MMNYSKIALSTLMILGFAGCSASQNEGSPVQSAVDSVISDTASQKSSSVSARTNQSAEKNWFTERDLSGQYDAADAVKINLNGNTAAVDGSGVSVSDGTVTISQEGVYLVSGTLNNGQIVVDADDSAKVQIVLNNAHITSETSAAIYAKNADKVFITLAADTSSTLENTGSYVQIDDNNIDSAVFAKTDLTLNGTGKLTVQAKAGHGIVSKDDLVIGSGNYIITAAEHALAAKDSLGIADGTFKISAGEDGIHAKNSDDASLGNLYIANGDFEIESGQDAISAAGTVQIDNGNCHLTTAGGSEAASMKASDSMGGMGPRGQSQINRTPQNETSADTISAKGIKAGSTMMISGGTFVLDTADDGVHAGDDLTIENGDWTISTGDDAIHSDTAVTIKNGSYSIPYCYEGVEGQSVTVDGGTFEITANDDGFNAAGGMDNSGNFEGRAGSSNSITVNGGSIQVVSDGDCLDSNGSIVLNGGSLNLTCNGNGNTAVDCDGTYANNGADITTNDGSENGGSFGGGMGPGNGGMNPGKGNFGGRR
ncbi:MAG: carbohydrate-binding domain-containing protein [Erysipelotrichaceae bacterium]|nr:carbohydrate-binding domain-containing protein [Erysipelotrichaceae bacterium]